jgi:hypothetical protein
VICQGTSLFKLSLNLAVQEILPNHLKLKHCIAQSLRGKKNFKEKLTSFDGQQQKYLMDQHVKTLYSFELGVVLDVADKCMIFSYTSLSHLNLSNISNGITGQYPHYHKIIDS